MPCSDILSKRPGPTTKADEVTMNTTLDGQDTPLSTTVVKSFAFQKIFSMKFDILLPFVQLLLSMYYCAGIYYIRSTGEVDAWQVRVQIGHDKILRLII